MQNKTVRTENMAFLPVNIELLDEIGIEPMSVIQMSVADGKLIIEKVTDTNFECDGDCENCPFNEEDCDGNCEDCPCNQECEDDEDERIFDDECTAYESCDDCPYCCPRCGECFYDFELEDDEDE